MHTGLLRRHYRWGTGTFIRLGRETIGLRSVGARWTPRTVCRWSRTTTTPLERPATTGTGSRSPRTNCSRSPRNAGRFSLCEHPQRMLTKFDRVRIWRSSNSQKDQVQRNPFHTASRKTVRSNQRNASSKLRESHRNSRTSLVSRVAWLREDAATTRFQRESVENLDK